MTTEPMTEAEQAVVDVLEGDSACTWHKGCDVEDCYGPRAAAIVAKLRPLLFEEVAERMLQHAQAAEDHDATEGAVYTFMVAADQIREWAAALRTTTPEKEN